mmetsp:Transcript_83607/g.259759  ORF Transcript_83607/g.259759 Transcript_83607/m.259759 type:complete len:182 (+) Transcript_83607:137-682(+)
MALFSAARRSAAALRPLAAGARPVLPRAQVARHFAANPIAAAEKLYEDLVDKSVKAYQANQKAVADDLDAELSSNKLVLFMEGTPDAPKSETSLNVVKMLTQAQVVPFLAVDTLAHPAILGYTVSKSARRRGPHLYVDGSFYADYDGLLTKYGSGELAKSFGTEGTKSSGTFGGELPIATY